jgi:bifunctional non-homologous end joining protein LigD
VFDVLQADGHNLTREPYSARRILLNEIASASRGSVVPSRRTGPAWIPQWCSRRQQKLGLEGIVCKHLDSKYTPGLRSQDWVKTPPVGVSFRSAVISAGQGHIAVQDVCRARG